jgi:hypothetical protein
MSAYNSLHGQRLGLGEKGQLVTRSSGVDVDISQPCVNATITVSAEGATTANTRDITIQLLDAYGADITYVETVDIVMFLTADRLAFVATGGSTGIDVGADGALLDIVAKKVFIATSEADGDIDLEWLDTGTEAAFLALYLPNGRVIMSDALTNA